MREGSTRLTMLFMSPNGSQGISFMDRLRDLWRALPRAGQRWITDCSSGI
jgi:hypothetical protein